MKIPTAIAYCGGVLALAAMQAGASTTAVVGRGSAQWTAALAQEASAPSPIALADLASPAKRHVFPVMDERGLLLTCIAPEIEINRDTDLFNNCALAPGRTLDDVMHSFIKAIHQEENSSKHEDSPEDRDQRAEQKQQPR